MSEDIWVERLERHGKRPIDIMGANMGEFLKITKDPDLKGIACLNDEDNALDRSGHDASMIENMADNQVRVCAVNHQHMIACSGQGGESPVSKYCILEFKIVDVDEANSTTKLKIYYNDSISGRKIFLGYMTANVSDVIGNKRLKIPPKKWYTDSYEQVKLFTIDLNKKGIKGSRELEFSLTTLLGYKIMLNYVKAGGYSQSIKNLIKVRLEKVVRDMDGNHSILSLDHLVKKIDGLLGIRNNLLEAEYKLKYAYRAKIPKEQMEAYKEGIVGQIEIIREELKKTLDEQKEMVKLYIEYKTIGDSTQKDKILAVCDKYGLNPYGEDKDGE